MTHLFVEYPPAELLPLAELLHLVSMASPEDAVWTATDGVRWGVYVVDGIAYTLAGFSRALENELTDDAP